jgi:DNA (cytosine-5)-methyltransferase 1
MSDVRFGSICSGIEAASAAWLPLGWECAWVSEVEPFPCAVLQHHYPTTPNLGDITAEDFIERARAAGPVDVIVGGTPCQSFSVAGLRGGIEDSRGNLALRFMQLVDALRPATVVWENVPGVLSSGGGRDFGAILGALVECGYGWAYRILDAQYFGVAQRRRRVFVVGCLGSWAAAAEILSLRESLQGHPAPSREAGERTADGLTRGANQYSGFNGEPVAAPLSGNSDDRGDGKDNLIASPDVVGPLVANDYKGPGNTQDSKVVAQPKAWTVSENSNGHSWESDVYPTLDGTTGNEGMNQMSGVTHALSAEGHDASEDGTGRGTPLVAGFYPTAGSHGGDGMTDGTISPPVKTGTGGSSGNPPAIAFDTTQISSPENRSNPQPGDPCHPLAEGGHAPAVAFTERTRAGGRNLEQQEELAYAVTNPGSGGRTHSRQIRQGMAVRRLTPRECERLQGFPDDYTQVPYRNKPAADGPRYRALGNSMAVPVVRWIGERRERCLM